MKIILFGWIAYSVRFSRPIPALLLTRCNEDNTERKGIKKNICKRPQENY